MSGRVKFEGELWRKKGAWSLGCVRYSETPGRACAARVNPDERTDAPNRRRRGRRNHPRRDCLALRREGHAPAPYDDGMTAWEAMERELPDLVVLDIGVPRLDGLDLCRRLRARSETLPIIFVTSREEEFDRVLGLEIGADDYLCKPFSMRELMARVKVLLRRASRPRGRAAAMRRRSWWARLPWIRFASRSRGTDRRCR